MTNKFMFAGCLLLSSLMAPMVLAELRTGLERWSFNPIDSKLALGCEHSKSKRNRFYLMFDIDPTDSVPYSHACVDQISQAAIEAWRCVSVQVDANRIYSFGGVISLDRKTLTTGKGYACRVSPVASRVAYFVIEQKREKLSQNKI